MRITIWHNMHRDHYDGYRRRHPMLRVFSYTVPDGNPETALWRAVEMFNAPAELLAPGDRATAAGYRERKLRSFSTGDGLSVLLQGSTAERFWVSNGLQLIPQPTAFERLGTEGNSVSQPLGETVTYLIPALGDQVRVGLFDTEGADGADLRKAIAAHHAVAAGDVVIIPSP
ncbi:hypothetical protein ACFY2H_30395 [Streptomyces griseofuscus]|uniref:hypothetical protein n=1 Tax=Streptomycetaceae TaxID=2062 RepID=UPI000562BF14|nr:hypothetical protein [Actinacidiphila yeochonensis]